MKNRNISLLLVMILGLTAVLSGCGKKEEAKVEEKAIAVEVQGVSKKNIAVKTVLSGKIKPIEEASVSPKVSGQVESLYVKLGDRVSAGDALLAIDSQSYQAMFNQAQAAYNSAQASYTAAVQRMENAKLNLERNKKLYEEGAISKQQYESMQLQALDADLETSRYSVESARAAMENARISLENSIVRAPISGTVALVDVNLGDMASAGMSAITITNSSKVEIEASVSENLINKVKLGQEVDIRIKSASEKPLKGKISSLAQSTTKGTMTYPIKVEMENANGLIKPGMFAEVDIVTESQNGVIAVPSESIIVKNGKKNIFTVEKGIAILKEVETGLDDGQYAKIEKGLSEGESIVVKGQNYIDDKSKVSISGQEGK